MSLTMECALSALSTLVWSWHRLSCPQLGTPYAIVTVVIFLVSDHVVELTLPAAYLLGRCPPLCLCGLLFLYGVELLLN
jgi:hypothetical protein